MLNYFLIVLMAIVPLIASPYSMNRADAHAPIGVMADHIHHKDDIMVSYRIMPMAMNTLINGTEKTSFSDINNFMMRPKDMQMTMHMVGAMWGASNDMTLTAMLGLSNHQMTMVNTMNQTSSMQSDGLNDLKLGAIINIDQSKNNKTIANIGISIPIGSIEETNANGTHLPYGMQLGSGTYDLIVGLTRTVQYSDYSIGAQINGLIRTGRNKLNYRLGNKYQGTAWIQKRWAPNLSTSARVKTTGTTDITGKDNALTASEINMSPMFSTNQGSLITDFGVGINYIPEFLKKTRVAAEITTPILYETNTLSFIADTTLIIGIQQSI